MPKKGLVPQNVSKGFLKKSLTFQLEFPFKMRDKYVNFMKIHLKVYKK